MITSNYKWDVFISHASEDKDKVVRPLVSKLRECGLKVWYDERNLKVGDRLRESIDRGLSKSRFGVIVLSKKYFEKKWPKDELEGLFALEIHKKRILPIWHDVSVEEVKKYSPILANRFAVRTSSGIDNVAEQLIKAINTSDDKSVDPNFISLSIRGEEKKEIRQIGNYKIINQIGQGGMGIVYLAHQNKPIRRKVALKLLNTGMGNKEFIARFESERQVLALLNHPFIAQVYDAGESYQGIPYFVMEYVPGSPLIQYCDANKLSIRDRILLFAKICDAIQYAHQKAIIHRDLKPSNILVTLNDSNIVPKVIDFGLAKAVSGHHFTDKSLYTQIGTHLGTFEYMSPEQFNCLDREIDTRTDVYSLGMILYEVLVGILPFDWEQIKNKGIIEIGNTINAIEPPRPSIRFKSLPFFHASKLAELRKTNPNNMTNQLKGDLDCIISKALDKDISRRYNSPAELNDDLRRYLFQEPINARPPSKLYRTKRIIQRHKAISALLLLIMLLLIAFSIWNLIERQKAENSSKEAHQNLSLVYKERALSYAKDKKWQLAKLFAIDSLLYQIKAGNYFSLDLGLPLMDTEWTINFPKTLYHRGTVSKVIFTDDGNYIISSGNDSIIKKWRIRDGMEYLQFIGHKKKVPALAIHPNNTYLASGSWDKCIAFWDIKTGKKILYRKGHEDRISDIKFSPDGNILASSSFDGIIKIWKFDSIKKKLSYLGKIFTGHKKEIRSICFYNEGKYLASGSSDGTIRLWDISNHRLIEVLEGHNSTVSTVMSLNKNKFLISGGWDKKIKFWDLKTREEVYSIDGHNDRVNSLALSMDSKILISVGSDDLVKIWEIQWQNGIPYLLERQSLTGATDSITSVALSFNGAKTYIASAGNSEYINLWKLQKKRKVTAINKFKSIMVP